MCKSQRGGQRCVAHTRPKFDAAETAFDAAVTGEDHDRLVDADQQWHEAAAEYASTPTGHDDLMHRLLTAQKDGAPDRVMMLQQALKRGLLIRDANRAAAALMDAADDEQAPLPRASSAA